MRPESHDRGKLVAVGTSYLRYRSGRCALTLIFAKEHPSTITSTSNGMIFGNYDMDASNGRPTIRSVARSQLSLNMPPKYGWGGARPGAGRKPGGAKAGMPHESRPVHVSRHPVHVTVGVVPGVPSLRGKQTLREIKLSLARVKTREGFRVVHFSVQSNHIHLLVEAQNQDILTRAVRALEISLARRLNRRFGRKGRFIRDRYHARALRTPQEARRALAYVLLNANKHQRCAARGPDPFSSGMVFDGWSLKRLTATTPTRAPEALPVKQPKTWLLAAGWKLHGLLSFDEIPKGASG